MNVVVPLDPAYVEARRVLLDALIALADHREAIVVAGAQAVYLRSGDSAIAVAPFTTDGDLALDPELLGGDPKLDDAMREAGFALSPAGQPGIWKVPVRIAGVDTTIPVDLIVPEGVAPAGGRRGARLGVHGNSAARRALGLEAALVDNSTMAIAALDPADGRSVECKVAGAAALLIAKAHKLADRLDERREQRLDDKDAADMVRLMQTTSPDAVGATIARLCRHPVAGPPSTAALSHLRSLFGRPGRPGVSMATRSLRGGMPPSRIEAICVGYTARMLAVAAIAPSVDPRSPS